MIDWESYANFTEDEFACRGRACCGGLAPMQPSFMVALQDLRDRIGFALPITSGYRCPIHNAAVSPGTGPSGPHTTGKAADISVDRERGFLLMALVFGMGVFTGVGWKQHGGSRFIHLDTLLHPEHKPRPTIWSYA